MKTKQLIFIALAIIACSAQDFMEDMVVTDELYDECDAMALDWWIYFEYEDGAEFEDITYEDEEWDESWDEGFDDTQYEDMDQIEWCGHMDAIDSDECTYVDENPQSGEWDEEYKMNWAICMIDRSVYVYEECYYDTMVYEYLVEVFDCVGLLFEDNRDGDWEEWGECEEVCEYECWDECGDDEGLWMCYDECDEAAYEGDDDIDWEDESCWNECEDEFYDEDNCEEVCDDWCWYDCEGDEWDECWVECEYDDECLDICWEGCFQQCDEDGEGDCEMVCDEECDAMCEECWESCDYDWEVEECWYECRQDEEAEACNEECANECYEEFGEEDWEGMEWCQEDCYNWCGECEYICEDGYGCDSDDYDNEGKSMTNDMLWQCEEDLVYEALEDKENVEFEGEQYYEDLEECIMYLDEEDLWGYIEDEVDCDDWYENEDWPECEYEEWTKSYFNDYSACVKSYRKVFEEWDVCYPIVEVYKAEESCLGEADGFGNSDGDDDKDGEGFG